MDSHRATAYYAMFSQSANSKLALLVRHSAQRWALLRSTHEYSRFTQLKCILTCTEYEFDKQTLVPKKSEYESRKVSKMSMSEYE